MALRGINPEALLHGHASPTGPGPETTRAPQQADGFSTGPSLKARPRAGLSYRSLHLFSKPPSQREALSSFLHRRKLGLREVEGLVHCHTASSPLGLHRALGRERLFVGPRSPPRSCSLTFVPDVTGSGPICLSSVFVCVRPCLLQELSPGVPRILSPCPRATP